MTLHRMAPIELQELKVQPQELLDKGFIRSSTRDLDQIEFQDIIIDKQ